MKKIFIACPFIKYIEGNNFINDNFKKFTEDLYLLCSQYASEVFLALKREDYGENPMKSYSCAMDLEEAENADLVIAIPDDSMGVAVELGWVSAMQKTVILILNEKQTYTPLICNINQITPGQVIFYKEEENETLTYIKEVLEHYKKIMDGDEVRSE